MGRRRKQGRGRFHHHGRLGKIAHRRCRRAPVLVAWLRQHPLRGLLLHHHGNPLGRQPHGAHQEIRRNVVRQVGDDGKRRVFAKRFRRQRLQIRLHAVGKHNAHASLAQHVAKHRLHGAIQLHGQHIRTRVGHHRRKQTRARADFKNMVARLHARARHDLGHRVIVQ